MKSLLRVLIQLYWFVVPESKRRSCLFRESCSKYVYRITSEKGFVEGIRAMKNRFQVCRAEYSLTSDNGSLTLHLCNGAQIQEEDIAINLVVSMKPMDEM